MQKSSFSKVESYVFSSKCIEWLVTIFKGERLSLPDFRLLLTIRRAFGLWRLNVPGNLPICINCTICMFYQFKELGLRSTVKIL